MALPLDPCLPFQPGEVPGSTTVINGGVVVTPEDDGDDVIITRYPTRPKYPYTQVPPGGGGGGGGGGDGDGGGGGGDGPSPRWKCELTTTQGFGGAITFRRCVSGLDATYPFATKAECEQECGSVGGVNEEPTSTTPDDSQYESYPRTDLGDLIFDEGYFPTANTPTYDPTIPNFSEIKIFGSEIDSSIYNLTAQEDLSISGTNENITELRDDFLKNAIREEIRSILYNLYLPDGRRVGDAVINKGFKVRTLNGTLSKVDQRYALNLAIRAALAQITNSVTVTNQVLTATYGKTVKQILQSRVNNLLKLNQNISTPTIVIPDINRALDRIESQKISLFPNNYTTGEKDLLKLWYVLPEDIYTKTLIVDASGTRTRLKIPNSEKIPVFTSGYESTGVSVLEYNYDTCVLTESGHEIVPSDNQLSRAYTLNNNVEQACLFDAQSKYNVTLTVSSPAASNLELNYDLAAERPLQYVFFIDKDTIQDVESDGSLFARKTKANYIIETDPAIIQQKIEFRPYPWLVLPVDHNDPILGHFDSNSTYTIQFTNFNLHQFGDDATGPILVRRIPKCVILQPTDKYNLLFYSGYSRLTDWNTRTLSFTLSPDPEYYNKNLKDHYFASVELAYPNPDITGEYTETGMRVVFSDSTATLANLFTSGSEPTRTAHGFRAAVNIASALNNIYYVNEGLLWTDVYKRLTLTQYYNFKMGIPNYMVDRLRLGQKTGVKIFHNKAGILGVDSRLMGLRSGKTDDLPIYLDV